MIITDPEAIRTIVLAEYEHWRVASDDDDDKLSLIAMGAMGACSNILAALDLGALQRWHTRQPGSQHDGPGLKSAEPTDPAP